MQNLARIERPVSNDDIFEWSTEDLVKLEAQVAGQEQRLLAQEAEYADQALSLQERITKLDSGPGLELRARAAAARLQAVSEREALVAKAVSKLEQTTNSLLELEVRADLARAAAEKAAAEKAAREEAAQKAAAEAEAVASETEASQGAERRAAARYSLSCEVGFDTDSNFYNGFTENISSTGLFLASYDLLEVGETVHLSFTLPGRKTVETDALVHWVREPMQEAPEIWPGMGLEFKNLRPEDQALVEDFVSGREPLFFPGG